MPFSLLGDALWIVALSIMASTTLAAWKRIDPQTTVPLQFALNGKPTVRLKRNLAHAELLFGAIGAVAVVSVGRWLHHRQGRTAEAA